MSKKIIEDKINKNTINNKYNADDIQILEGITAVRKRPGMYIGSTSSRGLHHLVYEIVDNSVDEALAGYCDNILITLNKNNIVTIEDNGRGIPVDINKKAKLSAVEIVFTVLHSGGKFGGDSYKVSGGLHGVGASVVNALSNWLEVIIFRDGNIYKQRYERGNVIYPLKIVGKCDNQKTGTIVTFQPDETIFETTILNYDILKKRFREIAFLTKGLKIILIDNRQDENNNKQDIFCYEGGIKEFVKYINLNKELLYNDVLYFEGFHNDIFVEVAIQHNKGYNEIVYGFVNNIPTLEGGYHIEGFRVAITRILNYYARKNKILKDKDYNLLGEDFREGLTSIISIKIKNPQFEGQTKQKLGNSNAKFAVETIVKNGLQIFLEQNPVIAKKICEKAIQAYIARESARKAREATRSKSSIEYNSLPGKLADCTEKDPNKCEIFIVEGDSAGGSAKTARSRINQAILPLRGKILNVEKTRKDKIFDNTEIKAMITAFGTGVSSNFDISKLRYNKIIIMTDADVDGAHISTLMLTFIYRFMPELIKLGHIYLARPPLYKIEKNKKIYYAYSDEEQNEILNKIGRDGNNKIQRYKGLGEMDSDQLWETTMNPKSRVLLKVIFEDYMKNELDIVFSTLMGEDVEKRREFIKNNAKFVRNLDI